MLGYHASIYKKRHIKAKSKRQSINMQQEHPEEKH